MTTLQAAVCLAALVGVLTINGIREHFTIKSRKDSRHLTALRGFDPYEADFDWRRNRAA